MEIFVRNGNFCQKWKFLSEMEIFGQKWKFFGQKWKFFKICCKRNFFDKKLYFRQTFQFLTKT